MAWLLVSAGAFMSQVYVCIRLAAADDDAYISRGFMLCKAFKQLLYTATKSTVPATAASESDLFKTPTSQRAHILKRGRTLRHMSEKRVEQKAVSKKL